MSTLIEFEPRVFETNSVAAKKNRPCLLANPPRTVRPASDRIKVCLFFTVMLPFNPKGILNSFWTNNIGDVLVLLYYRFCTFGFSGAKLRPIFCRKNLKFLSPKTQDKVRFSRRLRDEANSRQHNFPGIIIR